MQFHVKELHLSCLTILFSDSVALSLGRLRLLELASVRRSMPSTVWMFRNVIKRRACWNTNAIKLSFKDGMSKKKQQYLNIRVKLKLCTIVLGQFFIRDKAERLALLKSPSNKTLIGNRHDCSDIQLKNISLYMYYHCRVIYLCRRCNVFSFLNGQTTSGIGWFSFTRVQQSWTTRK